MQSVSVGGKASVALGDADAFAILDHDRRNIKAGVPSVVCLETERCGDPHWGLPDGLSQFGATLLGSDLGANLADAAVPLGFLLRQPSLVKSCLHVLLPFFLMASEKDNARSYQPNRGDQQ
jgi:hypothetical protein